MAAAFIAGMFAGALLTVLWAVRAVNQERSRLLDDPAYFRREKAKRIQEVLGARADDRDFPTKHLK